MEPTESPKPEGSNLSKYARERQDKRQRERQWGLVTEATRRECIINPEVRNSLIPFCSKEVTQTLPMELIESLSSVERINNLASRYKTSLVDYLGSPPTPKDYYGNPNLRYVWGRDVKILALGAEILNQDNLVENEKGEIVLPSGVKIFLDKPQGNERSDLLSPHLWERRRQLKDRVHEIEVNGRKYILKERKTAQHYAVFETGYKEGVTSEEEFKISQDLQKYNVEKDGLMVTFEKPVGYALYPDGFQFSVFEFEEGLVEAGEAFLELSKRIIDHWEIFEKEYKAIKELAKKYNVSSKIESYYRNQGYDLTFEEFSRIKAHRILELAEDLHDQVSLNARYKSIDSKTQYLYRITDTNGIKAEIVDMDFEYLCKMSEGDIEETIRIMENSRKRLIKDGLDMAGWDGGLDVTRNEKAGYLALLEKEELIDGKEVKEKRDVPLRIESKKENQGLINRIRERLTNLKTN